MVINYFFKHSNTSINHLRKLHLQLFEGGQMGCAHLHAPSPHIVVGLTVGLQKAVALGREAPGVEGNEVRVGDFDRGIWCICPL